MQEPGLVGVHDGVRPFVSVEVIRRCYELAEEMCIRDSFSNAGQKAKLFLYSESAYENPSGQLYMFPE